MFSDKCASRLRVVEHGDNLVHDANRNVGVSRDPFRVRRFLLIADSLLEISNRSPHLFVIRARDGLRSLKRRSGTDMARPPRIQAGADKARHIETSPSVMCRALI